MRAQEPISVGEILWAHWKKSMPFEAKPAGVTAFTHPHMTRGNPAYAEALSRGSFLRIGSLKPASLSAKMSKTVISPIYKSRDAFSNLL